MEIPASLVDALARCLARGNAPGMGLPTWGYLFVWDPIIDVPGPTSALLEAWLHTPLGCARLSDPDACDVVFRRLKGLPLIDANFVIFDVARFVDSNALYFGVSRGSLAAGGSRLDLVNGEVVETSVWRS